MKKPLHLSSRLCGWVAAAAVLSCIGAAKATPYASCISNNTGTVTFILNEGGGNVWVTHEDGSTNAAFDGVTTGLNQTAGLKSFSLGTHTTYAIHVFKLGSGTVSETTWVARGGPRGLAVNQNGASPWFGRVYSVIGGAGVVIGNSDGSLAKSGAFPGSFWNANSYSPNKLTVAADDSVIVGDYSTNHAGVWSFDPNFVTSSLLLGPVGMQAGVAADVHGAEESQPILVGSVAAGNAQLYVVDGDYPSYQYNSILRYDIGSGPLPWQTAPNLVGAEVNPNLVGDNQTFAYGFVAGLSRGPTGYLYVNVARANLSNPNLQVYAADGTTMLWNSYIVPNVSDYFGSRPYDSALSPDGKYIAMVHVDNHLSIITLTNDTSGGGIPDISTLYTASNPRGATGNGRGIAWDAAGNLWVSSSGLGGVQQFSLGRTATAVTTGNASGPTGFQLLVPDSTVSVYSTNGPTASQANSYGNPTTGHFTIVRTGSLASPLAVFFTLAGSTYITNGTYTASATTTVTIPAGASTADVSITPVTDGKPRPTGTVTLTLAASSAYQVTPPNAATILIINTGPNLLIPAVVIPSMYKAFSNDYATFRITRWGDTNAPAYTASTYTYAGTAVAGQDYSLPDPVTFNPGELTHTIAIVPRSSGQPPVHTANPAYTGNKTAVIGMGNGTGYSGASSTATLTILDDAYPPATVLYSNPLTESADASNWNVTSANRDMANVGDDYDVQFGYDLTDQNPWIIYNGVIPLPPNGATTALRVSYNKIHSTTGVVNLYPTNVAFSGDYAVRFNMNFIQNSSTAGGTYPAELAMFGINHNGTETNFYTGDGIATPQGTYYPWASDGIFYMIDASAGGLGTSAGDFMEMTGAGGRLPNTGWMYPYPGMANGSSFVNAFKSPVYTAAGAAGIPVNGSPLASRSANTWSDVEIKQIKNVVTLTINKTTIFAYNNTNTFTSGTLMLGYGDPYSNLGNSDGAAYFSNLRVVRLGPPSITSAGLLSGNMVIHFATIDGDDTTASFTVQSSATVDGTYANVSPAATITQDPASGLFTATTAQNGPMRFYRIKHN